MVRAAASVEVAADAVTTWAAVVDWDLQARWMLLTTVRATSQDGRGVGAGISARTAVGPVGFTDDMVISVWEPPRACRVRHLGRIVRGEGVFEVEPAGAGSRFTWAEELEVPFGRVGALGWPLARPVAELLMRISVRRLGRLVAS